MRKSHVRRLLNKQSSSLTPVGNNSSATGNISGEQSRALISDSSIRFSTCAQSTPKRAKLSITTDDEDPFADEDEPDYSNNKQNQSPNIKENEDQIKLPSQKPKLQSQKPPEVFTKPKNPVSNNIRERKTFLHEVLENCKFYMEGAISGEHLIKTDKALFIRDLEKMLNKDSNDRKFLSELEQYHEDNEKLKLSFHPTRSILDSGSELETETMQDCFIRLLLQVGVIQSRLIVYLMDRVFSIVTTDKENEFEEGMQWISQLLRALSYLDVVYDSKSLCDQLLNMLDMVQNPMIKQEIINSFREILNFDVHSTVAVHLSNLLERDESLMPVILETLSTLTLSNDTLRTVQEMTIQSLSKASLDALPSIVNFLMFTTDGPYDEIINGMRSHLTFEDREISRSQMPISTQNANEKRKMKISTQKKVFSRIRDKMLLSKTFFESWLKNLKKIPEDEETSNECPSHNPIDFIILILLYDSTLNDKHKEIVVKIFKNLILRGVFTNIINPTLTQFISILKDEHYFMPLMKMVTQFIKSSEKVIIQFTSELLCEIVQCVEGRWVRWILTEIVSIIGCGDTSSVQNALKILSRMCLKFGSKISPMACFVSILLNKLDDFHVYDARQLLSILCGLSHGDGSHIHDDINILIQKKISSYHMHALRIGIIGSTLMIKQHALVPQGEHNTLASECSTDTATTAHSSNQSVVLTERGSKALNLLKSIQDKLRNRGADVKALFYDQLNYILFRDEHIDVTFKVKVTETMKQTLREIFYIENYLPENLSHPDTLKCSAQFSLDRNEKLCINIAQILTKENSIQKSKVLMLPVIMRLLRVADYYHDIDHLINFGLILPIRSSYEVSGFTNLCSNHQEIVLSSLFITINCFIELLNCFSNAIKRQDEQVAQKVLLRLQQIIFLKSKLSQILPFISSATFVPPRCYFHVDIKSPVSKEKGKSKPTSKVKKTKGGTKRKRPGADPDESKLPPCSGSVLDDDPIEDVVEEEEDKGNILEADMNIYKSYFRELETDVWLLFKMKLVLNPTPEKDDVFSGELGPSELLYLLDDCVLKLERSLPPTIKKIFMLKSVSTVEKQVGFEHIDSCDDVTVLNEYMTILDNLCTDVEMLSCYLHKSWIAFDKINDSPQMFIPETRPIKLCLTRLYKSMAIVFSWTGFQKNPEDTQIPNAKYLIEGLTILTKKGRTNTKSKSGDVNFLVNASIEYLCTFRETIQYLPTAVSYIKLLRAIAGYALEMTSLQIKISEIAWEFLTRRWYTLTGVEEKGAVFSNDIEYLFQTHFDLARGSLNNLDLIFSQLLSEVDQFQSTEGCFNTIPTIKRSNFNVLIRCLCRCILNEIRHKSRLGEDKVTLEVWLKTFEHMEILVKVLRDKEQHKLKTNLLAFIKQSKEIFKLFLKEGFALCGTNFRIENDLVCKILKKLQASTRYIQNICNHTKKTEDIQMAKELPLMKQMMETIILQVKNIMRKNDCGDAILVANLKIRDVAGKEIDISDSSEESDIEEQSSPRNNEDQSEDDDDRESKTEEDSTDVETRISTSRDNRDSDNESVTSELSDTSSLI